MRWVALALVLGGVGCKSYGEGEVSGDIDGTPFNEVGTVFSGTSYILIFDRKVECIDMDWLSKTYTDGEAPTETEFNAIQFGYDDLPVPGTQSVEGESVVTGWGMLNTGGTFDLHRARQGTITIDDIRDEEAEGSFSISFGDGGVNGTFQAAYCRNLR